jgi:hypothetical protein
MVNLIMVDLMRLIMIDHAPRNDRGCCLPNPKSEIFPYWLPRS